MGLHQPPPNFESLPYPRSRWSVRIVFTKLKRKDELKIPGEIFPICCAFLSTRSKTVGGWCNPPPPWRTRVNILLKYTKKKLEKVTNKLTCTVLPLKQVFQFVILTVKHNFLVILQLHYQQFILTFSSVCNIAFDNDFNLLVMQAAIFYLNGSQLAKLKKSIPPMLLP